VNEDPSIRESGTGDSVPKTSQESDPPAADGLELLDLGAGVSKDLIRVPESVVAGWEGMLHIVREVTGAALAVICRAAYPDAEVICSSPSGHARYGAGARVPREGLFCDEVFRTNRVLHVPNTLEDARWSGGPDAGEGLISFLGQPLRWPDGDLYGAVCALDGKGQAFRKSHEDLLASFGRLVETELGLLYRHLGEKKNLEDILDELADGIIAHDRDRRILFFNRAAEEITGFSRADVLGRDCHDAFGVPFCGSRCSFQDGSPLPADHLYYPLNILRKSGEPRRVEMAVTGRYGPRGDLIGVIASFRDLSHLLGPGIELGEVKGFAGIIGRDPRMLDVYRQIRDLATNAYPVHITGETGTGKELAALAIHNESRRGGGPFVPGSCAALPEGMLESELFGHVRGAFTGAIRDKKGRFELADGGTLFLDEVADLPKPVQAKLLRVLQEGSFERVGGEETVLVDVRLISATNRDLKREVEKGAFRQDLYYRVNVVPVHMPPLRERGADIRLLIEHFLNRAQDEGQDSPGLSPEALSIMMKYPWPGNVRELHSAVRFALVRARGRIIRPGHLPLELREYGKRRGSRGPSRKLEEGQVRAALAESGGNRAKAARLLGVGRATLYRYLADNSSVS